jgi:anti-anti-sigma factor
MSTTEDRLVDLEPGEIGIDLVSATDGSPIVFLRGEIDAATVGRLAACLDAVAGSNPETVSIGFAEVTFMDSSGINALLDLRRTLGSEARIHLRDCSPAIRRMCDVTGLTTYAEFTVS